jgi:hypothetical protein
MELRIVVLLGVAAVTGWVARGVATGSPAAPVAAAATPAPPPRVVYVTAPGPEGVPAPDDAEAELDAGEDLGEVLARAQREAAPAPPPEPPHNMITGVVADQSNGDRLAGVTVVASGPLIEGTRTAITDESGAFVLADLPAGSYTVTLYYVDATVERSGVTVSSYGHTTLDTQIATGSYLENIPVPGRTFESVLGSGDGVGISFSGTTSLDNVYVVDGIDETGM